MDGPRRTPPPLADPQAALDDFLGSLLAEGPSSEDPPLTGQAGERDAKSPAAKTKPPSAPRPAPAAAPPADPRPFAEPPRSEALLQAPLLLPQLDLATAETAVEPQETAAATAPVAAPPGDRTASVVEPAVAGDEAPTSPPPPVGMAPAWAGGEFQCLAFVVAGITLATPLEKLSGIVEWPGELTELPGYAPWFMGLLPTRGQNVRVIDTAQIVMPDGRVPDSRPVTERVKYVVLIDEGRWGLAADAIDRVLTLAADGVRWRGSGGKRPWLAGTAVEQMCAVLDIDNLAAQLAEGLRLDDD